MTTFTPDRLSLARMRRGMQKQELAERCNTTDRTVRAWEQGEWTPEESNVVLMSRALRFPTSFFYAPSLPMIDKDRASFRSMSSMKAAQRDSVHAAGTLCVPLAEWLVKRFKLPTFDVPDLGGRDPEASAIALREAWNLGIGPAPNMVHLLELHGVRVFSLVEDAREVDAFSFWSGPQGFVMLNTTKSVERGRFDAAHELGHLVMHQHVDLRSPEIERQANQFASAFLMPSAGISAQRLRTITLETALALKAQWHVSLGAMAHRLSQLGYLTEWQYREMAVEIQRRGWRTSEPNAMTRRETSQVLAKAFGPLRRPGHDPSAVAKLLHLGVEEVQRMIFGLVLIEPQPDIKGAKPPSTPPAARAHLRIVHRSEE